MPCFRSADKQRCNDEWSVHRHRAHTNAGFQEKTAQDSLVARSLTPDHKSGAQFSQHKGREPDFIGEFDRFDNGHTASAQLGIAVRLERQPHRHISLSMVSCAARALSKAKSLRQVPAMSRRSRCRSRSPVTPAPGPALQSRPHSGSCPAHGRPCGALRPK